ncbi:hypothetical protein OHV05_04640 [Kitasatospora sp. NBC_00070]|uniref:hypothetical protein n=1 Tax=Kitasatospora sp. NBC_00070 TaxID=2975962 RepID=UPI003249585E
MYSEPEIDTAMRMRSAHHTAASTLAVAPDGEREAWGWRGRTLGRPVTGVRGNAWLRLVCAPVEKAGGKIWDGPQEAERSMPPAVPRPHLRAWHTWTEGGNGYLAELYAYSLLVPETAAEIRHHLGHILDTPAGRFAELVVATELLQGIERGDHTELEGPLRSRIGHLIELRG